MNLDELRGTIDEIDHEILSLFLKRMETAEKIGIYKKESRLSVSNKEREREILCRLIEGVDPKYTGFVKVLFNTLFEMSYSVQKKSMTDSSPIVKSIEESIKNTPMIFPKDAVVACQGVEGAYSQLACDKLFSLANIMYMGRFDKVFQAVESGLCQYGVLPLENSTAGSVNEVYDLMNKHNFYIVRSIRLRVQHALITKHGVKLSDVKEIFSHEQAINQCSIFIKSLNGVKVTVCENTAAAAKLVAQSDRRDVAAICSENCAGLYDLSVLSYNIQDNDNNYTRFICISKKLEIYPGAHKTSIIVALSHRPGSLCGVLSKFNVLGINLNKLESRPVPRSDFEFKFYFDIEAPIYSDEVKQVLSELERESDMFDYLGSYMEV